MCIEQWLQRFFSPFAPAWTSPAAPEHLDALDVAVVRRLRYLALCPLAVAAWFLASLGVGGASAMRLGTLGGAVMQSAVLCSTSLKPRGRTLAGAQHLANFFTMFLVFSCSALPLLSWTTSQECDLLHTSMWRAAQRDSPDAPCALLMWDLLFASLFVGGTIQAMQVARRLETGLLMQLLRRSRDADVDAAEKGGRDDSSTHDDHNGGDTRFSSPRDAPRTRRAAGLMGAPRAEVITRGRSSSSGAAEVADAGGAAFSSHANALFVAADCDGAPRTPELRGVLITVYGPGPTRTQRRGSAAAAAPEAAPTAAKPQPLARKLTQ